MGSKACQVLGDMGGGLTLPLDAWHFVAWGTPPEEQAIDCAGLFHQMAPCSLPSLASLPDCWSSVGSASSPLPSGGLFWHLKSLRALGKADTICPE